MNVPMQSMPMQPMYRGYQPGAPQRSPQVPGARRMPGPMMSTPLQAPLTPAQIQAQHAAAAAIQDQKKRLSRKPTDRNIPDGVEDIVGGELVQQYKSLRDLERRLGATMMRKRMDIQEAVNRTFKRSRTLRVWISNTVENQPWQERPEDDLTYDFSSGLDATYRVKIEGKLLDDEDDINNHGKDVSGEGTDGNEAQKEPDNETAIAKDEDAMDHDGVKEEPEKGKPKSSSSHQARKKFSHYIKSLIVDYPQGMSSSPQQGQAIVEWKKPRAYGPGQVNASNNAHPAAADFDALFFQRMSDENLNVVINLTLDENPERYTFSKELAQVLDSDEDDRAGVVMGIWAYVRAKRLQEDEERRAFRCDDALRAIFHRDRVEFPQVLQLLEPHLKPLPPLQLPYTIRVDRAYHQNPTPTIYDIRYTSTLEDPLRRHMQSFLQNPSHADDVRKARVLDEQMAVMMQALTQTKARHEFWTAMTRDPVGFLRRWLGSQQRDLEVILGESDRVGLGGVVAGRSRVGGGPDVWRKGGADGVWGREEVRQSVGVMLAKPVN